MTLDELKTTDVTPGSRNCPLLLFKGLGTPRFQFNITGTPTYQVYLYETVRAVHNLLGTDIVPMTLFWLTPDATLNNNPPASCLGSLDDQVLRLANSLLFQ